jgi:hypothetical protein
MSRLLRKLSFVSALRADHAGGSVLVIWFEVRSSDWRAVRAAHEEGKVPVKLLSRSDRDVSWFR